MKEDLLTGFFLRAELAPYLESLIEGDKQFTLGLIDLNNFKTINDKYGHVFGDGVLKYVSSTIKLTFAERGIIFRYGGDEFIVVFPEQDKRYATILFKLCNRNLKKRPFLYKTRLLKITVSYGMASYPADGLDVESLVHKADVAMYCSKKIGKGAISDIARINVLKFKILIKRVLLVVVLIVAGFYFIIKPVEVGIKKLLIEKKVAAINAEKKAVFINAKKKVASSSAEEKVTSSSEKLPSYACEVIFKNGAVLKGNLIEKDEESITLLISMGKYQGKMRIEKSLIRKYRTFRTIKD